MNVETLRNYCIQKKEVTESFPFDDTTLVMKVKGRMFALINLNENPSVNLKCDPELAIELRERYSSVLPGYHMNKQHWNTIALDGSIPTEKIKQWVDHSYDLVIKSIPNSIRKDL